MKFISSILSVILFLNTTCSTTWGVPLSPAHRLKFQEKLQTIIKGWNQASDYSTWIEQSPMRGADKAFLKNLVRKERLENAKPFSIDYHPKQNKIVAHLPEGENTWHILSMAPTVVLYDGTSISEVDSQSRLEDFYKERPVKKDNKKSKQQKKSVSSFFSFIIPEAIAETEKNPFEIHNETMQKQADHNKKEQKRLNKLPKMILWTFLISIPVFLVLGALWNSASSWGAEAKAKKREEERKLKREREEVLELFPAIDLILFPQNGEIKIKDFTCKKGNGVSQPGRIEGLTYKTVSVPWVIPKSNKNEDLSQNAKDDLGEDKKNVEGEGGEDPIADVIAEKALAPKDRAKKSHMPPKDGKWKTISLSSSEKRRDFAEYKDELQDKLRAIDECCANSVCEEWLKERFRGDPTVSTKDFMDERLEKIEQEEEEKEKTQAK